jgi:hypothetical protein
MWIQEPTDGTKFVESVNGKQRLTAAGIADIEANRDEIMSWVMPACR